MRKALLKDLLLVTKDGEWGKGEPSSELTEMKVIRGTDFADARFGSLENAPTRFIPNAIATRKSLQATDILLETAGGTKDQPTGRSVFLRKELFQKCKLPITCASFSRFLRPDPSIIYPEYLFWLLQYLYTSGWMYKYHVQHTGVARFQYTNFAETTEIPLPPLSRQREIAEILGDLDKKIEVNRAINETLEAMARALFKSWFVDFDPVHAKAAGRKPEGMDAQTAALFPDSFQDSPLGKIPKGWRFSSLADAFEINPRRISSEESLPYVEMQNLPIRGHCISEWVLRATGSGARFKNGDTLLARITPCLENGKTGFVDFLPNDDFVASGSTEYIVLRPKPPIPLTYAYYLARTEEFRAFAISNMTGTSGRQRVPADCLKNYNLCKPAESVGKLFGAITTNYMQTIRANVDQSKSLEITRDLLLPKLLNGDLSLGKISI